MVFNPIDSLQNSLHAMGKCQLRREGFIDEALVRQMVIGDVYERQRPNCLEIAMSSSEDDYAGWNLPAKP